MALCCASNVRAFEAPDLQVPVQLESTVGACIPVIAGLLNLEKYQSFGLFMSRKVMHFLFIPPPPFALHLRNFEAPVLCDYF